MKTLPGLLSMLLVGMMGSAQPPQKTRDLTEEERKVIAQLRSELDGHLLAGKFEDAVRTTKRTAEYRAERQGEKHWEVMSARLEVERRQRLTVVAAKDREELARGIVAAAAGEELQERLRYREAEGKLREALALHQKALGEQHPETAITYNSLALCLSRQGKHADAVPLMRKALDIRRKVLGEQHPETAQGCNNLGFCLNRQGHYAEALPLLQKALDLRKQLLGEAHPHTAASYNNVAICLNRQGKHGEALPLMRKALAISQKVHGEEHPDTATHCNDLASCLHSQGMGAEALPLVRKALAIRQKVLGEQHPDTALSYKNLAACLIEQGKFIEALPLYHKALDTLRRALGEQHPRTALGYNGLASCLSRQGKHAEAVPLFQKALDIRLRVLGEQHSETAQAYNNLGFCLKAQGRYAEALPLLQRALNLRREALGENHPFIAQSYNNVASCLNGQGKPGEALPLMRQALAICQKVHGEEHPDTATHCNDLAGCLDKQGKHAEALSLVQKALAIRQKVLGEQHPGTAHFYNNVASCLDRQGKHDEAQVLFHKSLDILGKVLGDQHPLTAHCYHNLALCLYSQGKYAEAAQQWENGLLGHEFGRLQASDSGFDRSLFRATSISPRAALAASLVRLDRPGDAWRHAESDLARGLLDDLLPPSALPATAVKLARLNQLDQALLPLLTRERLKGDEGQQRDRLSKERDELLGELARDAAQRTRDHVLPLELIQKQIPSDAAVVLWLDVLDQHLGCVLRREGPPVWVKLPGFGKDDSSLPERTLAVLADRASDSAARQELLTQLHRQRIAPLEGHLKGVRSLLVVPAGKMAKVPVEALTERYTISYIPSASVFARRMEKHRPLQATSLLVLADPIFTRTTPKPPGDPPHGLLIQTVTPGSLGARSGLRAGDVLLEYADKKLTKPDDLRPTTGDERIPVKLWREGKARAGRLPAGDLGIVVDKRPIAEALAEWHKQGELLAVHRAGSWQALPGTRLEARILAGLVEKTTTLLGSEASEAKLDELAAAGKLKEFRLLHLATHGEANEVRPRETALVLAQDNLPTTLNDAVKSVLSGKRAEGKLTVGKVIDDWELDADLVVLSACQTGLGKATRGEGMLGFTQALMQKGARSVVLSRWKVDDAATSLLMARFYENLLGRRAGDVRPPRNPLKRAEALAEARSWLRQLSRPEAEKRLSALVDGVPRGERGSIKAALPTRPPDSSKGEDRPFAHPYYWAAFVLLGDPH